MINGLNPSAAQPQNFLSGLSEHQSIPFVIYTNTFLVHGTPAIDASSSPSPQSTYSPQSSPSESRTSPNVASKQQSTSNMNNKFPMTNPTGTSTHAPSHHNDLTGSAGGGGNSASAIGNRLPGRICFYLKKKSNRKTLSFVYFRF